MEMFIPQHRPAHHSLGKVERRRRIEFAHVDGDGAIGPCASQTELPPGANVLVFSVQMRTAEDRVQLRKRKVGKWIALLNKNAESNALIGIGVASSHHLQREWLVLHHAAIAGDFERANLTPDNTKIGGVGEQGARCRGTADQIVGERNVRMVLLETEFPTDHYLLQKDVTPATNRSPHYGLRLISRDGNGR